MMVIPYLLYALYPCPVVLYYICEVGTYLLSRCT